MTTFTTLSNAIPADGARPLGLLHHPIAYAPMRAVIGKELRENFNIVIFTLLILSMLVSLVLWNETNNFSVPLHPDSALLAPAFLAIFLITCPIVGLLLGLSQILSERPFDLRSFLVHRAMTRSRLFLSKIVSGLLLYFLAVGVPLLLLILISATSVRAAWIFDIRLTYPYLLDFISGITYYFAGMLMARRQGRLWGSRLFPIIAAIAGSLCAAIIPDIFHADSSVGISHRSAFFAITFLDGLLLLAAWNCYIHLGVDTSLGQSRGRSAAASPRGALAWFGFLGRFALPAVMVISLTTLLSPLLFVLTTYLASQISHDHDDESSTTYVPHEMQFSYYRIMYDGTPLRMVFHGYPDPANPSEWKWDRSDLDLAGNPVPPAATQQANEGGEHQEIHPREPWFDHDLDPGRYFAVKWAENFDAPADSPAALRWYYFPKERYFIGIDLRTHRRVKTFGATGILPITSTPQPFAENPFLPESIVQNDTLFRLDSSGPALEPLLSLAKGERFQNYFSLWSPAGSSPIWFVVVTDKNLYFLDNSILFNAKLLFSIPIEHLLDKYELSLSYYRTAKTFIFDYTPRSGEIPSPRYIVTYSPTGELLHRYELPPLPPRPELDDQMAVNDRDVRYLGAFGVIDSFRNPLLTHAVLRYSTTPWRRTTPGFPADFLSDERLLSSPVTKYYFPALGLPALLFAIVTFWFARRYRFNLLGTIFWPLATLLLGPVGFITLLFTQPLPTRLACPHCHRQRVVTGELCEHCGSPFPRPLTNGTEILAPTEVPA